MDKDTISIHPEHGVNPTILLCPVCNKETNELALLGYNKNKKADKYSIGYNLCDECEKFTEDYITFIVVKDERTKERTGEIVRIRKKAVSDMFPNTDINEPICCINMDLYNKIKKLYNKLEKEGE